jgi:hypothetical protein
MGLGKRGVLPPIFVRYVAIYGGELPRTPYIISSQEVTIKCTLHHKLPRRQDAYP